MRFLLGPGRQPCATVSGIEAAGALGGYAGSGLTCAPGESIILASDFSGRLGRFISTTPDGGTSETVVGEPDRLVAFA